MSRDGGELRSASLLRQRIENTEKMGGAAWDHAPSSITNAVIYAKLNWH